MRINIVQQQQPIPFFLCFYVRIHSTNVFNENKMLKSKRKKEFANPKRSRRH